jgi:hypothetical protein
MKGGSISGTTCWLKYTIPPIRTSRKMIRQGLAFLRGFLVIFQLLPFKYMRTSYHSIKNCVKDDGSSPRGALPGVVPLADLHPLS